MKVQTNIGSQGPLHGLRILDLTSVIMGPFATQTLGDMGADIITIETLDGGGNRAMGSGPHEQLSGIALNLLRNKRSISLDLKHAKGREVALRIAADCAAMVTNLRPEPLKRLRLAYDDIVKVQPNIVYCQAQGFRTDSSRGNDPAYDDTIQAESGLADASHRAGRDPVLAPTILADKICGLTVANAVIAALFHRERTGNGQRIEVPMQDVMTSFMLLEHGNGKISIPPSGDIGWARALNPERGPQRTRDGWINILPYSSAAFDALFVAGGRPDLVDAARSDKDLVANATLLYQELKRIIAMQTTDEWMAFCDERRIPVGRVRSLEELVEHLPTLLHPVTGKYHVIPPPIWFTATPAGVRRPAPLLGQDGASILAEAGYGERELGELVNSGALYLPAERTLIESA